MTRHNMNANSVSKSQFKANALRLFRQVEASGQTLIVTDHGKPTLEVRPYRACERNPPEVLRGSVMRYDNPTDPIADEWSKH
jgi:antitoxin (DNA-binding transcriptional repressor) of toxin-antitoxin stability system